MKYEFGLYEGRDALFIKTGRARTTNPGNYFGIEPLIEVICYRLCVLLQIPCAEQRLGVGLVNYNGNILNTLISISPDFRKGKEFLEFGDTSLYMGFKIKKDYLEIAKVFSPLYKTDFTLDYGKEVGSYESLLKMVIFDFIIANTDRHMFNFGYLVNEDNTLSFSPLYDHGYSLLFDDINSMIKGNFTKSLLNSNCNNTFYSSFRQSYGIIKNVLNKFDLELENSLGINVGIRKLTVENMVKDVYAEYNNIKNEYSITNIDIDLNWFIQVVEFIWYRLEELKNVRNL